MVRSHRPPNRAGSRRRMPWAYRAIRKLPLLMPLSIRQTCSSARRADRVRRDSGVAAENHRGESEEFGVGEHLQSEQIAVQRAGMKIVGIDLRRTESVGEKHAAAVASGEELLVALFFGDQKDLIQLETFEQAVGVAEDLFRRRPEGVAGRGVDFLAAEVDAQHPAGIELAAVAVDPFPYILLQPDVRVEELPIGRVGGERVAARIIAAAEIDAAAVVDFLQRVGRQRAEVILPCVAGTVDRRFLVVECAEVLEIHHRDHSQLLRPLNVRQHLREVGEESAAQRIAPDHVEGLLRMVGAEGAHSSGREIVIAEGMAAVEDVLDQIGEDRILQKILQLHAFHGASPG